tara:strand:- start:2965 stop:3531 length:567 start_codon:yes stop_codon:yes gene_type:complete
MIVQGQTPQPKGSVIWITGLSGAGKTSIARCLIENIKPLNERVILLDGDDLRGALGIHQPELGHFDRGRRVELGMLFSKLSNLLAGQGFTIIVATISLYKEIHKWNADHLPNYFEVYLSVPEEELRQRDPKGIYKNFDAGKLSNVVGLDMEFDEPAFPSLKVEFEQGFDIQQTANFIQMEYNAFLSQK